MRERGRMGRAVVQQEGPAGGRGCEAYLCGILLEQAAVERLLRGGELDGEKSLLLLGDLVAEHVRLCMGG